MNTPSEPSAIETGTLFPDTRWSAVSRARAPDTEGSQEAIDTLCATYWKPIYWYIRYLGQGEQDAEDLTQEFFRRQLGKRNLFLQARREQGKLRTYVCVAVRRLVANAVRDRNRQKRGGGQRTLPLEFAGEGVEGRPDQERPDHQFDRKWAEALAEIALSELGEEYAARGQGTLFKALRGRLSPDHNERSQEALAGELGMTVGALRMSLTRMRKRFRDIFRAHVAATVAAGQDGEVDEELRYLVTLFE